MVITTIKDGYKPMHSRSQDSHSYSYCRHKMRLLLNDIEMSFFYVYAVESNLPSKLVP